MLSVSPINTVLDRMVTLSRAMDEAFGAVEANGRSGQQYWVPSLDAWETEHAFHVQLDLPGHSPEDVDISFDRNTLTIRGKRAPTVQAPEKGEIRVFFAERPSGAFTRSLRFPSNVTAEKIEAQYQNGVLTITLPKAEEAKPRKIAITSPIEMKQVAA